MAAFEACARGTLPPNVALMQVLIEAEQPDEIEPSLQAAREAADPEGAMRLDAVSTLWRRAPRSWETVRFVLAHANHGGSSHSRTPAHWAQVFDRLAGVAPDAGAALYALGSADLLAAATASIIERLRAWDLLRGDRVALDLGCGPGRITAALAREVRAVIGIDVSRGMLSEARRRCAGLNNVLFAQTSGRDLGAIASGAFDLVLAVDTFPYLVLAGDDLASIHLKEAYRVLKPGGSLIAFNYSYGGNIAHDSLVFRQLAEDARLESIRLGTTDLAWWDGVTYHVRRPA